MKKFLIGIVLFIFFLFTSSVRTYAVTPGWTPPEDYRTDESLGGVVDSSESNDEVDNPKVEMSLEDIFGSEQVFPFEPGLGN